MSGGRTAVTANGLVLFAVWTDRRTILSVDNRKQDVAGSRVQPLP